MVKTKNVKMRKNNEINRAIQVNFSTSNEMKKLSTILFSIIGIICVFYIITVVVTKNTGGLKYSVTDEVSQISYTDILASDILRKDGTYYVFVEDADDYNLGVYDSYISSYVALENSLPIYYVDLNDALNQKYKASENDFSSSNLKFNGTSLLKIVDGKVELSFGDNQSIMSHLRSLSENK